MAVGTTTALILGAGAAGAGVVGSKKGWFGGGVANAAGSVAPMPEAPGMDAANQKAAENVQRRRSQSSKTIYTSPLGVGGSAQVARKTLLGQ